MPGSLPTSVADERMRALSPSPPTLAWPLSRIFAPKAGRIKRRDRLLQAGVISLVLLPALAVLVRALRWLVTG